MILFQLVEYAFFERFLNPLAESPQVLNSLDFWLKREGKLQPV